MTEEQFAETAVALRRLQREWATQSAEFRRLQNQCDDSKKQLEEQLEVLKKLALESRPLIAALQPEGGWERWIF
jgi:septal ring factor EnvC (AmiA/AmiB activator)